MATLSPASSSVASSHAAEALLSRARRLSHNAYNEYERSRPTLTPSIPTAFAEGEELILPSSSTFTPSSPSTSISATAAKLSSPSLSPTSCLTTASLHQKHRESFNGIVREHGRKRSSAQRLSSASTTSSSSSTTSSSSSTSTSPAKTSSPASTLFDPNTSSSATSATMVIMSSSGVLKQQVGQGLRGDQGGQKQEQDQQQQQSEGAEGRQEEQLQPHPLTPSSSDALSSSPKDASLSTNTTASNSTSAQTSTPSPSSSLLCPTITQTTTTTDPSRSLTIVTRPRALTLEAIRELRESSDHNLLSPPATSGNATTLAPLDQH
ncbi:hypothetical protein BG015_010754, partial [Linnemannia schmuckeri]